MSIARHHAEWLSLVPVSGPFLSLPVLLEAFNTGLEPHDPDQSRLLRQEYANWQESFEKRKADPAPHHQWIKFVLTSILELEDRVLAEGQAIPQTLQAEIPEHHELLRPSIVLIDPSTNKPRLLVQTYPRSQELTSYVVNSRWKASPDTRMTELLHATGVRLGLVTNGEQWMLVDAPKGETTGYSSWYAALWLEEPITLRAFRGLLSASRFFNVPDDQTLEALFTKSASNQQEVTDQLGYQVRRAVEVLIHSLDRADQDFGRQLLAGVREEVLYESALTVMMRLVFLFCAEERELIPSKPFPVYEQNYSVSTISKQLRELADQHGEELLERRYDAWPRLLAAFRAVYGGLRHDDVHIPAYGGNLFNPDRFPFLEGRKQGTTWRDTEANPLPVNNRTVLHLLEALQMLQIKVPGGGPAEARRLSFRALDIEQIGHVYEGLLDHTAKRAVEPMLGLTGTRDKEPEIALAELAKLAAKGEKELLKFLKEESGRSESAIKKSLNAELEDQLISRFRTACQDADLWKRVEPFAGLIRLDNVDYPVVITTDSVFVTAGTDRRSSGTHYTPKSLTEPIVQYTLEPLVYIGPADGLPKDQWKLKSAKELLALKICDMACGSGAFLVQACRYLAARLIEAWDAAQRANPGSVHITPEGESSTGKPGEMLIPEDPDERQTYARRIVAQRCLYGVDKNPLAVEMCKLSLWLLTMAKDKPFEFLDHNIRCGDSLVGIHDLEQLRHFSLKPDTDDTLLFKGPLDSAVDEAINLRLKLVDLPANTVEDVERQEKLLIEANEKMARLRCAADMLVAAEFWGENAKDKLENVRFAANRSSYYVEEGTIEEFEQVAAKERRGQTMFHWPLEFPEVIVKRGGFDAFVGNPPFLGGTRISTSLGSEFLGFLQAVWGRGNRCDFCAYFFRRAYQLLSSHGLLGLIGTNTIAQGDTRTMGLVEIVNNGGVIVEAHPSLKWPGVATVEVARLVIRKSVWDGPCRLSGTHVSEISTFLTSELAIAEPYQLRSNAGLSFTGTKIYSPGFLLSPAEAQYHKDTYPKEADIIKPYYDGRDINSTPEQAFSRYVIDFSDWPEDRCKGFPGAYARVTDLVKPSRITSPYDDLRDFWWRFQRVRKEMYECISGMKRVLVRSRVSNLNSMVFVPTGPVFSDAVVVFATDKDAVFATLQSSLHTCWLEQYASSLRTDVRYTPTDCFETFPLPEDSMVNAAKSGAEYHSTRERLMLASREGLTKTYNRFHDSDETDADIQNLRELHIEMDWAVAAAYSWANLDLGHGFHETKQGVRFTISEPARREVLQRLLKLNHERYAEEVKQGLHDKKKAKTTPKPKTKTKPTTTLFGEDATFPSSERDNFLSGLVCDLVASDPGLPVMAYIDSLVIALGYKRHKKLLVGTDRTEFAKLCKASPLATWSDTDKIPWAELHGLLSQRKAIALVGDTFQVGADWADVRKSYSTVAPELLTLLRKAAAELRDLQAQFGSEQTETPDTIPAEKAELLKAFGDDRDLWYGVAA
ncbi:hypothetical protein BH11PLA2_BH11PLA2_16460 [soil metagenome]